MASVRGNSRKKVCRFPPVRLDFDNSANQAGTFAGQRSLKLVTHCTQSQNSQDNLLEEYAAYRIFQLFSDAAYRVRLLKINYEDTGDKYSTQKLAFVIEPTRALGNRIDGKQAKLPGVSLKRLNKHQEALVYIFQYLIGNTDWSLVTATDKDSCCHNGKIINQNDKLLYIPYDFDRSGLVNARYAKPAPSMRIKRVTQRKYRGFCMDRSILSNALKEVTAHQAGISDIINDLPDISAKAKEKAHRFLGKFFEEAANEQDMLNDFERSCLD